MEEQRKIIQLLQQIPQPGFLVQDNRILQVNQAASALLLTPGQSFTDLLHTGAEEYAAYGSGELCLTLTIGGQLRNAVVSRVEDADLVLLDRQEEQEEFRSMALVAMELRQPLMQAMSGAHLLARETDHPAIADLNRSLMQILRMVGNMSDAGRYADFSRQEMRDVNSFLQELFEKAQTLAGNSLKISFDGLPQPLFSRIDPEQLERAVWNILSNCIKFTPAGGSVHATLTHHGNMLRLTVQDSGSGIAEAVRGTLFHRYLRQPCIEDSRYGLGLGLAMVRIAAANHGGTVLVHGNDAGTRITMTLAIRPEPATRLRSPLMVPDYAGGWDHALVELADSLGSENYKTL